MGFTYLFITFVPVFLCWYFVPEIKLKIGVCAGILIISYISYIGYFEQIFAKKYGGNLTITIPDDAQFIGLTWKDNDLWYGYHDTVSGKCVFQEQSRYGLMEGKVFVKNCNPI